MSASSASIAGAELANQENPATPVRQPNRVPLKSYSDEEWGALNFILVGLVFVLVLTATATASQQIHRIRIRDRLIKDLTNATAAIHAYMRLHKASPPDTIPGVVPPGMSSMLAEVNWTAPTPVGGHYRLVNLAAQESGGAAPGAVMIALTAFPLSPPMTLSRADLIAIDRQIDDGNIATGNFRVGFGGWPVLWVNPPE